MGACVENMWLEAAHLGLGAVWLGVAPLKERMTHIKNLFNLPDDIYPFCIMAVGYPADALNNRFIDRFDESRISYDKYNK